MHHNKLGLVIVACLLFTFALPLAWSESTSEHAIEEAASGTDKATNGEWQDPLHGDENIPLDSPAASLQAEPDGAAEAPKKSPEEPNAKNQVSPAAGKGEDTSVPEVTATSASDKDEEDRSGDAEHEDDDSDSFAEFVRNKKLSAKLRHQKDKEKEKDVVKKELLKQRARAAAQLKPAPTDDDSISSKEQQSGAEKVVVVDSPKQHTQKANAESKGQTDPNLSADDQKKKRIEELVSILLRAGFEIFFL
jgi:hypothetical protein